MNSSKAEHITALPDYLRKRGLIRATIFSPENTWKMLSLAGAFLWLTHKYLAKLTRVWWTEPDWSHGFIIPLFCLYFLASNYQKLLKVRVKPARSGFVMVMMGLAMQALAFWLRVDYGVYLGMIVLLFGMVLWLGGWAVIKIVWVPILFLIFAVNIPEMVYRRVAYQLQQFAAVSSVVVLQLLGVMADMAGDAGQAETVITLWDAVGNQHQLNVEEACSGMRLIMAFGALAVAISYLSDRPAWQRIILIIFALPVAIFCNLLRVVITGVLYHQGYPEYAQGLFHTFTGLLMLIPAGLIYLGLAKLMDKLLIEDYSDEDVVAKSQAQNPSASQAPEEVPSSKPEIPEPTAQTSEQTSSITGGSLWRRIIVDKRFLSCLVIVLVSAGTLEISIQALKIKLRKEPAELRKELTSLPVKLGSFEVVKIKDRQTEKMIIDRVLSEELIHALGTSVYIDRRYRDSDVAEGQPPVEVSVFSTYYTGKPDLTPHVPERCQAASGYTQTGSETFELDVADLGLPQEKLTVKASIFTGTDPRSGQPRSFPIIYFFVANGKYFDDWKSVRWHLNAPQAYFRDKYSYYAFFRLTFPQSNDKEQCIVIAKKFLKVALPEMIEIWPDWQELSNRP